MEIKSSIPGIPRTIKEIHTNRVASADVNFFVLIGCLIFSINSEC